MKLLVTAENHPKEPTAYAYKVGVQFRGKPGNFDGGSNCSHMVDDDGNKAISFSCDVECGGGGLEIAMAKDDKSAIVKLEVIGVWDRKHPDRDAVTLEGGDRRQGVSPRSRRRKRMRGADRPQGGGLAAAQVIREDDMDRRNVLLRAAAALGAAFAASRANAATESPAQDKLKVVYHLNDLDKVSFVIGNIQNHLDGVGGPDHVTIALVVHGPALRAFHQRAGQPRPHPACRQARPRPASDLPPAATP